MAIKLFRASDNSELSVQGQFANCIDFGLRADLEEMDQVRVYAEADAGFSVADVVIDIVDNTADGVPQDIKWSLAPDVAAAPGAYGADGASLNLGVVGNGAGKVFFWVRGKATSDETAVNDVSVLLNAYGVESAV